MENGFGILSDNFRVGFLECDVFVGWGLTNLEGEIFILKNVFIPIVHLPIFSFISRENERMFVTLFTKIAPTSLIVSSNTLMILLHVLELVVLVIGLRGIIGDIKSLDNLQVLQKLIFLALLSPPPLRYFSNELAIICVSFH